MADSAKSILESLRDRAEPQLLRRIAVLLSIIVIAVVLAFCFFAGSLCITLLLAVFLAILIDPVVSTIERWGAPRILSAALVVILAVAALGFFFYLSYDKAVSFVDAFPDYAARFREIAAPLLDKIERVKMTAGTLAASPAPKHVVHVASEPTWPSYLVRGVGSMGGALVLGAVVPFLMFFMLARKEHIYNWLLATFGAKADIPRFVRRINQMIRGYVLGNLLVGAFMAAVTVPVLLSLHLHAAVSLGISAAILNLIPFIGLILSGILLLLAAMLQFTTLFPYLVVAFTLTALHLISANLLIPKFVGSRVNIGPVAATVGMLFWGWLWGAAGILLAIPLTAAVKLIADTHPTLTPISNLLAETPRPLPEWLRTGRSSVARAIPFLHRQQRSRPEK